MSGQSTLTPLGARVELTLPSAARVVGRVIDERTSLGPSGTLQQQQRVELEGSGGCEWLCLQSMEHKILAEHVNEEMLACVRFDAKCIITMRRLVSPSRGFHCRHFPNANFDALVEYVTRHKRCPFYGCNMPILRRHSVVLDSHFQSLLASVPPNVESVYLCDTAEGCEIRVEPPPGGMAVLDVEEYAALDAEDDTESATGQEEPDGSGRLLKTESEVYPAGGEKEAMKLEAMDEKGEKAVLAQPRPPPQERRSGSRHAAAQADGAPPAVRMQRNWRQLSSAVATSAAAQSEQTYRRDAVGRRLSILWLGDGPDCWYEGAVLDYAESMGKHLVRYDDGDTKWHFLGLEESLEQLRWSVCAPAEMTSRPEMHAAPPSAPQGAPLSQRARVRTKCASVVRTTAARQTATCAVAKKRPRQQAMPSAEEEEEGTGSVAREIDREIDCRRRMKLWSAPVGGGSWPDDEDEWL